MGKEYRRDIDVKSSVLDFERVLLFDSFEEATIWVPGGTVALEAFSRSATENQAHGLHVGKVYCTDVGGAAAGLISQASRTFPYLGSKKVSASCFFSFSVDTDVTRVGMRIEILDGVYSNQFGLCYNTSTNRMQYLNSIGAWADSIITTKILSGAGIHFLKFSVNFITSRYTFIQCGPLVNPVITNNFYSPASANPIENEVTLFVESAGSGVNPIGLFDAVLIMAD